MKFKHGCLRVWWKPQIPMNNSFYVGVDNPKQGRFILNTLAKYDLFQLMENIKPDYCNVGGLEVFENNEWVEWNDDNGYDIDNSESI